jgi:hypothetical protein
MSLLFVLFGLLLLLIVLICADARGGSIREAIDGNSQHGLRYVVLGILTVTFVSLMVAIPT